MSHLSVNINKIALLRNSRGGDVPNVLEFAEKCLKYGAHGITLHPRPDQRHARYQDVLDLQKLIQSYPDTELNVEGNPTPEFLRIVKQAKPAQCTLVPDAPNQLTSDHGWILSSEAARLKPIICELKSEGIRVSLFLDPDLQEVEKARDTGADRIELYTESYAKAYSSPKKADVLSTYAKAAARAQADQLGVNAGHDLNLENLGDFLKIPGILEVSIGHALIVECLTLGLEKTIQSYLAIASTVPG